MKGKNMEELIKTPFDEEIETERLILKRHQLTFEYANIFFNLIKENKEAIDNNVKEQ